MKALIENDAVHLRGLDVIGSVNDDLAVNRIAQPGIGCLDCGEDQIER